MNNKIKNELGNKYGDLLVIAFDGKRKKGNANPAFWLCQCSCGNIVSVDGRSLRNGNTKSCGCKSKAGTNGVGKIGDIIGKLTVESYAPEGYKTGNRVFRCECGEIEIMDFHRALCLGDNAACKKCRKNNRQEKALTKKQYKDRLYGVWACMIQRCYNKNNEKYPLYGERGIKVCDEWRNSFDSFAKWAYSSGYYIQPKDTPYKDRLSIDRINNDGNYCPENCQWISVSENTKKANKEKSKKTFLSDPIRGEGTE